MTKQLSRDLVTFTFHGCEFAMLAFRSNGATALVPREEARIGPRMCWFFKHWAGLDRKKNLVAEPGLANWHFLSWFSLPVHSPTLSLVVVKEFCNPFQGLGIAFSTSQALHPLALAKKTGHLDTLQVCSGFLLGCSLGNPFQYWILKGVFLLLFLTVLQRRAKFLKFPLFTCTPSLLLQKLLPEYHLEKLGFEHGHWLESASVWEREAARRIKLCQGDNLLYYW